MKLEEYLKGLRECPDEQVQLRDRKVHRLSAELGIYFDNFFILLNADYQDVLEAVKKSRDFVLDKVSDYREFTDNIFRYLPGSVSMQLIDGIYRGEDYSLNQEELEHLERQKRDYNLWIILNGGEKPRIKGVSNEKAMALAIDDITKILVKNKWRFCFPRSIPWKSPDDFSQVVYWEPTEEK